MLVPAPRPPRPPLAPLAALAALAAVAALATLAAADDSLPRLSYVTMLQKGLVDRELDESLGPFYIPHGQCSGVLDSLLRCGSGALPAGVRVRVQDAAGYARVALADTLRAASVLRAPPCRGEAAVTLRLACQL